MQTVLIHYTLTYPVKYGQEALQTHPFFLYPPFSVPISVSGLITYHPGAQGKNQELILDSFSPSNTFRSTSNFCWFYLQNIPQIHPFLFISTITTLVKVTNSHSCSICLILPYDSKNNLEKHDFRSWHSFA